ncbi:MAG: hypothetical protein BGN92_13765 [Sphingobacteriales bacterium 41-5]|nr:MAG: hypothetical protein BGN92_13765 [Sphingobacteriales bacterium 41-5]
MKRYLVASGLFFLVTSLCSSSCSKGNGPVKKDSTTIVITPIEPQATFNCTQQTERTDYQIYKMCNDGTRVGDINVYYDEQSGQFNLYYLKNIWNDVANKRHPWYAFTTTDFTSYAETGELLSCSADHCAQDFAIGSGSVIKANGLFYVFYTGFNPHTDCSNIRKEGIMLATSNYATTGFAKDASFTTLYAPKGVGYDEYDNFRDPYVFKDDASSLYYMLLSARKNVNGTWRGVITYYTSTDLRNWNFKDVFYDGGNTNFFMMETPQLIKLGSIWYLIFSDSDSKYTYYRKVSSLSGTWDAPVDADRFDGKGIYAAKIAKDKNGNAYLFGWNYNTVDHTDAGAWMWGGNLIIHKISQKANNDLIVGLPESIRNYLSRNDNSLVRTTQTGNVTATATNSFNLNGSGTMANVVFNSPSSNRYVLNTTINYKSSFNDFGFMIGNCDASENFYSIRFVPSLNTLRFDTEKRSALNYTTVAKTSVPITLSSNTDYKVTMVVENSIAVVYVNDAVALTCRIYKSIGTSWGIFADNSEVAFNNISLKTP